MEEQEKKRKLAFYTTLQIIGILIIMIVGNAFDWLNMKFDFTKIKEWGYWNGVIQQIIMFATALVIGYLGRLEKEILNNIEYHNSLKLYRQLLKNKGDTTFEMFINYVKNPSIKKLFIKKKAQVRLYRLDKFAKDEYKLEYDKAIESGDINTFTFSSDKSKKYSKRRLILEQLYSDEYIDKNYRSIDIKYPRINAQAFTYGVRIRESKANNYKVENTTAKDLMNKWLIKAVQVILVSFVFGSIVSDASGNELVGQINGWLKLLVKYIIRCIVMVSCYIMGLLDGKRTFESNYLDVIINRTTILKEYLEWVEKEHIEDSIVERMNRYLKSQIEKETEQEIKEKKINQTIEKDTEVQIDDNGKIELTEKEIKEVLARRELKNNDKVV